MPTHHHILFYGRGGAGKRRLINELLMALFGVELLPNGRGVQLAVTSLTFGAPYDDFYCSIDLVRAWERDEYNTWTKCPSPWRTTVCRPQVVTEVAAGIELALSAYEADALLPLKLDITLHGLQGPSNFSLVELPAILAHCEEPDELALRKEIVVDELQLDGSITNRTVIWVRPMHVSLATDCSAELLLSLTEDIKRCDVFTRASEADREGLQPPLIRDALGLSAWFVLHESSFQSEVWLTAEKQHQYQFKFSNLVAFIRESVLQQQ